MNYLFFNMEDIEANNGFKFERIEGELSVFDKIDGNWDKSVPFYHDFIFKNRIDSSSIYYNKLCFELFDDLDNEYIDIYQFIEKAQNGKFYYRIV